jgi:hypothetical protein
MKVLGRGGPFGVIPAVGEQHSAYIEEDHVEGEHRRLSVCVSMKYGDEFPMKQSRLPKMSLDPARPCLSIGHHVHAL